MSRKPIRAVPMFKGQSDCDICKAEEVRELEAYTTELEKKIREMECCGNCKTYEIGWCPDREIDIDGTAYCDNWCMKDGK